VSWIPSRSTLDVADDADFDTGGNGCNETMRPPFLADRKRAQLDCSAVPGRGNLACASLAATGSSTN
jgi:hypothetical protein